MSVALRPAAERRRGAAGVGRERDAGGDELFPLRENERDDEQLEMRTVIQLLLLGLYAGCVSNPPLSKVEAPPFPNAIQMTVNQSRRMLAAPVSTTVVTNRVTFVWDLNGYAAVTGLEVSSNLRVWNERVRYNVTSNGAVRQHYTNTVATTNKILFVRAFTQ